MLFGPSHTTNRHYVLQYLVDYEGDSDEEDDEDDEANDSPAQKKPRIV